MSWIKIATLLLHKLGTHCLEPKDCGQIAVRLCADRLYHFMPTQSWLCSSDICTGQLVSVRNMIPDVHSEAPVIEGNSMHLERA